MYIVTGVFCALIAIMVLIYLISTRKFSYWKNKGVPFIKPWPILGNYARYILLQKYFGQAAEDLCQKFHDEPYFGTYFGTEPALVILSPDYLKLVLMKDFYYFHSRFTLNYNHHEETTQNLFFAHGNKWKILRQNLSPLFSSSKMRNMFPLIEKGALALENILDIELPASNVLQTRPLMIRYTVDCICSCAFGIETNTLVPNSSNNPFTRIGNVIFATTAYRGIKWIARNIWPGIFYRLGFKCFPDEMIFFFSKLLDDVFKCRQYKPSARNDFVDLLLKLKLKNYIEGDSLCPKHVESTVVKLKADDSLLQAQSIVFFAAGFETSASVLACTLYELAKNQEAQRRAQNEIDEFMWRHNNKLKYECVSELPYLEACIEETIRLYPVLPVLTREVVEDYTFPNGLHVEKGLRIHIPVYYLHRNPDNFPEPEKFLPERFLPETRHEIKPYTFFPFGEGPRFCIGMRFSKMQVISGLIAVLKKYSVELAEGTPSKLEFEATTILTQPTCDLALKLSARSGWEERVFSR